MIIITPFSNGVAFRLPFLPGRAYCLEIGRFRPLRPSGHSTSSIPKLLSRGHFCKKKTLVSPDQTRNPRPPTEAAAALLSAATASLLPAAAAPLLSRRSCLLLRRRSCRSPASPSSPLPHKNLRFPQLPPRSAPAASEPPSESPEALDPDHHQQPKGRRAAGCRPRRRRRRCRRRREARARSSSRPTSRACGPPRRPCLVAGSPHRSSSCSFLSGLTGCGAGEGRGRERRRESRRGGGPLHRGACSAVLSPSSE